MSERRDRVDGEDGSDAAVLKVKGELCGEIDIGKTIAVGDGEMLGLPEIAAAARAMRAPVIACAPVCAMVTSQSGVQPL